MTPQKFRNTLNVTKAVKAEGITHFIAKHTMHEEAKDAVEYAEWILAEVRHAAQCAHLGTKKDEILERLWQNVIKPAEVA